MGDDTEEEVLVQILIDPIALQEQVNYIKTIWLLNKEDELEAVVKLLEYLQKTAKTKQAINVQEDKQQELNMYIEQQRHMHEQQMAEQRRQQQMIPWTTGTTTAGTKYTGSSISDSDLTASSVHARYTTEIEKLKQE